MTRADPGPADVNRTTGRRISATDHGARARARHWCLSSTSVPVTMAAGRIGRAVFRFTGLMVRELQVAELGANSRGCGSSLSVS